MLIYIFSKYRITWQILELPIWILLDFKAMQGTYHLYKYQNIYLTNASIWSQSKEKNNFCTALDLFVASQFVGWIIHHQLLCRLDNSSSVTLSIGQFVVGHFIIRKVHHRTCFRQNISSPVSLSIGQFVADHFVDRTIRHHLIYRQDDSSSIVYQSDSSSPGKFSMEQFVNVREKRE